MTACMQQLSKMPIPEIMVKTIRKPRGNRVKGSHETGSIVYMIPWLGAEGKVGNQRRRNACLPACLPRIASPRPCLDLMGPDRVQTP